MGLAHHSETHEELVVYKAMYTSADFGKSALWVRSKKMFYENVIIDGKEMSRFADVSDDTASPKKK